METPEGTTWANPLVGRYASLAMSQLWGPRERIRLWRLLWIALAEAQAELGLTTDDGITPRIRPEQLAALREHVDNIDFAAAAAYERRFRHDVMAHVHAYGDVCPAARDILHLGATSCYVTDNADLIVVRRGLQLLRATLLQVAIALADFAERWKNEPTLGYTHFQPAQLTTVGKRACLWLHDFVLDLEELDHRLSHLKFRGAKGTTGTQASFLTLFHGDHAKVRELDRRVALKMGFDEVYPVTGQTYSRKVDSQVLDVLSGIAQSAHKFGTDLRLLQHHHEIEEPFESEQIGSSAMAYKRNPMRAERLCGLARFVMHLVGNTAATAAVQWLERTLDDSVNRRLVLPQAFLASDAMMQLLLNISQGLEVHPAVIQANVQRELPFMATENILMAAVCQGQDRQEVHERIRQHSQAAASAVKQGQANDLMARLAADPTFAHLDLSRLGDPHQFVGRAPEQVTEFLAEVIAPLRVGVAAGAKAEIHV